MITIPFAGFKDFADCEAKAPEKVHDTGAYCGAIKHETEDKAKAIEKDGDMLSDAGSMVKSKGCPECGGTVKEGNKYCSWECGSAANRKKVSELKKSLLEMTPGTQEHALRELSLITKEAEGFHSARGPRGAPVMVNPKTGEKEYGHNAKRIQHVKEHGDKREDAGPYTRTKDLAVPHGHSEEVKEKSLETSDLPILGSEGMLGKAECLNTLRYITATRID